MVVVALVDGYGYTQWRRDYEAVPFLDRLTRRAGVTPLTSVYPSETAAAMTTLHTGRTPAEHGLLGWNLYVEADDLTIRSLPFRTLAGEDPRSVDASVTPADLFAGRPIYERLGEAGVTSHVLSPESLAGSAYSSVASAGAATPGYADVSDAEASLRRIVESAGDRTYVLAYFPQVDAAGHETGTESATYRDRLSSVAATLGRFVRRLDAADARRTLLVVTADHGQVNTDPTTNVDLLELDGVASRLRRHGGGETDAEGVAGSESPVVAGSARNVHLFCEEEPRFGGRWPANSTRGRSPVRRRSRSRCSGRATRHPPSNAGAVTSWSSRAIGASGTVATRDCWNTWGCTGASIPTRCWSPSRRPGSPTSAARRSRQSPTNLRGTGGTARGRTADVRNRDSTIGPLGTKPGLRFSLLRTEGVIV
ncbi:alkaline phosphatase family protein [Haloplanus sp. GCM10025708]|uniref:alkaline phosphatase family protein n=1 Tax=Haloplanus sp. GCM10025708 TaxID=3252679 RepID=UPI0036170833